jgi:hypothetical protein
MQSIRTRYYGPTNTRGSRIVAKCYAGSLSMPRDYSLDPDQDHARVAGLLASRLNWAGVYHGGVFEDDFYWVCESGWTPTVEVSADNVGAAA